MIELHQSQLQVQKLKSQASAAFGTNPSTTAQYSNHSTEVSDEVDQIQKKLQEEMDRRFAPSNNEQMQLALVQAELEQFKRDNQMLKEQYVNLNSEIYGSRLTAKYLEKELAGRIQQIQLFGKNLKPEEHERLWNQLESEINLHRHKTVIKACRNKKQSKVNTAQLPISDSNHVSFYLVENLIKYFVYLIWLFREVKLKFLFSLINAF